MSEIPLPPGFKLEETIKPPAGFQIEVMPRVTGDVGAGIDTRNDFADTAAIAGGAMVKGAREAGNPLGMAETIMRLGQVALPYAQPTLEREGVGKLISGVADWLAKNKGVADPMQGWASPTVAPLAESFKNVTGLDPRQMTSGEKVAEMTGAEMTPLRKSIAKGAEIVGGMVPFAAIPGVGALRAPGAFAATTGLAGVGAAAGESVAGDAGAFIGSILTPIVTGRIIGAGGKAINRMKNPPPTRLDLERQAATAYDEANRAGVVFKPEAAQNMVIGMAGDLGRQGLRLDSQAAIGLYPGAARTMQLVNEELALGPMTLERAETLRRNIQAGYKGAVDSKNYADARLISRIKTRLDNFVNKAGPDDVLAGDPIAGATALRSARDAYTRSSKAETIEELIDRAVLGKSKFAASGIENSLRQEFRAFARRPREMRFFTPEERAAIRQVAEGSLTRNALRFMGRFALRGPVSGSASLGTGAVFGSEYGIGLALMGEVGRQGASMGTRGAARSAEEMMRRGYKYTQPLSKFELDMIRSAISAAGSQTQ